MSDANLTVNDLPYWLKKSKMMQEVEETQKEFESSGSNYDSDIKKFKMPMTIDGKSAWVDCYMPNDFEIYFKQEGRFGKAILWAGPPDDRDTPAKEREWRNLYTCPRIARLARKIALEVEVSQKDLGSSSLLSLSLSLSLFYLSLLTPPTPPYSLSLSLCVCVSPSLVPLSVCVLCCLSLTLPPLSLPPLQNEALLSQAWDPDRRAWRPEAVVQGLVSTYIQAGRKGKGPEKVLKSENIIDWHPDSNGDDY